MDKYQYLIVLAFCLVGTLPLEFVIGARVYRRPKALLLTIVPVAALFAVWDFVAIERVHWWFNQRYVTGFELFAIPIEEFAFFIAIPLCGLLTYEAVERMSARRSSE